ncbi:hypothetical protein ACFO5R_17270 [Halosolutus amylolyticus]|uniref:DUF3099 domain-containing protein n=1 Tax=Halosolutus amylolyticus TaxID=2932267 RepID=A0ABD5PTS4_9EURY|nr:hypothetical protein [Halosolutus amylolyticus]
MASSTNGSRLRDFWSFYRRYTATAIHTAAAAALAIFGILVFVDPWFAALAIGSYVLPPVVLYVFEPSFVPATESTSPNESGPGEPERSAAEPERSATTRTHARGDDRRSTSGGTGDTDTDSDRIGGDTDTDSDRDDGDTDSDTDGGDTDSDSDDGDTDSDSDG